MKPSKRLVIRDLKSVLISLNNSTLVVCTKIMKLGNYHVGDYMKTDTILTRLAEVIYDLYFSDDKAMFLDEWYYLPPIIVQCLDGSYYRYNSKE